MIEHLAAMLVSAIAFLGAILLYGAFSPRRLGGWKFWICFAAYCVLMEGAGPLANGLFAVYGIIGNNVGQQILYNTTIYCLFYVISYKEKPMMYLSVTVIPPAFVRKPAEFFPVSSERLSRLHSQGAGKRSADFLREAGRGLCCGYRTP